MEGTRGRPGEGRVGEGEGKEEGVITGEGRTGPEAETTLQGKGGTERERSSGKAAKRPVLAEKVEGQERGKEEETVREVEGGKEAGTRTIV